MFHWFLDYSVWTSLPFGLLFLLDLSTFFHGCRCSGVYVGVEWSVCGATIDWQFSTNEKKFIFSRSTFFHWYFGLLDRPKCLWTTLCLATLFGLLHLWHGCSCGCVYVGVEWSVGSNQSLICNSLDEKEKKSYFFRGRRFSIGFLDYSPSLRCLTEHHVFGVVSPLQLYKPRLQQMGYFF